MIPKLKESVKRALGPTMLGATRIGIRRLQIQAMTTSMRRHGWTLNSLHMSDEQAAIHFANDIAVDEFVRLGIRLFHEFKLEFLNESLGSDYIEAHSFFEIGD